MPVFAIPYPIIDPVLLQMGPIAIRWYALAYIVGILIGWWYARRLVANPALWGPKGSPIAPRQIGDFVVWLTIGVVVGGRLGYVLVYDFRHFFNEPLSIFALWEGGMSFHGGFAGTIVAMLLFARRAKVPLLSLADIVAAAAPIGLLLGRLANFVNGELFGRMSDVPWAMVFPNGGLLPRHPSQLYEAALEGIVLFIVLRLLIVAGGKLQTPGFVGGAFIAFYGCARVVGEIFREPEIHFGFLTMGMILSIPMIVAGIWLMRWSLGRPRGRATRAA